MYGMAFRFVVIALVLYYLHLRTGRVMPFDRPLGRYDVGLDPVHRLQPFLQFLQGR